MMYWMAGFERACTSTAAPKAPFPTTRIFLYLSIVGRRERGNRPPSGSSKRARTNLANASVKFKIEILFCIR
jgi:hypothetical protein